MRIEYLNRVDDDDLNRVDITLSDGSLIAVWWLGSEYRTDDRAERQRYGYSITDSPDPSGRRHAWQYVGDDIYSGCDSEPDVISAAGTLVSFLLASAESYSSVVMSGRDSENYSLFPSHVSEYAYMHDAELSMAALELEPTED